MSTTHRESPNYDVEIDADELLADLAEMAAEYGEQFEEYRSWWHESLDWANEQVEARYWMEEERGGQRALSEVIASLQPESAHWKNFRDADGSVDVRGLMAWVSRLADDAHERAHGTYTETRQADEAETAFASVLLLLRDDYGVGWPRLDKLGGNPLEKDLP